MVDAGKEIGVVADRGRKHEAASGGVVQEPRALALDAGAVLAVGVEHVAHALPQCHARLAAEREQRIERRAGRGLRRLLGGAVEQAEFERRGEVEDVVPDRNAAAGGAARRCEHAERQVLDREVGMRVR